MKRKINKKFLTPKNRAFLGQNFRFRKKFAKKNFSVPFSGGKKSGRRDNMSFRRPFSDNLCMLVILRNTAVAFCGAILDVLKPLA